VSAEAELLVSPPIAGRADYVLILEWLGPEDRRTGRELHEYLKALGRKSILVVCNSARDVRTAIENAHGYIQSLGVPVIHIEAHGSNPAEVAIRDLDFGADASLGLPWTDLGYWLAPLNEATGFRLLVVGATCFGAGVIAAMQIYKHVAPFAGCVGFTTPVNPGSLRDAMREFYRSLFSGVATGDAVENARRELRDAAESLRCHTSVALALRVLRGAYDELRTPEGVSEKVASMLEKARQMGFVTAPEFQSDMPRLLQESSRAVMQKAWDCWFPPYLQDRVAGYRLNWDLVL
jgi:hypothetical protein